MKIVALLSSFCCFGIFNLQAQLSSFHINCVNTDTITHHKVKLDPEYFVLGTLFEYSIPNNGRYSALDGVNLVDIYFPQEKSVARYMAKYIKEEFHIIVDTIFTRSNHCSIYSEEFSKRLNHFYDKNGLLNDSIFKTREQICSFITGVFYRYGWKIDSMIYGIRYYCPHKYLNLKLLLEYDCESLLYKKSRSIYFRPGKELENYLFTIEDENSICSSDWDEYIYNMAKEHLSKEEFEKDSNESKLKLKIQLRSIFLNY